MPTISVIMPCRNAAATLVSSLRSLRAQTQKDWELIAVDDGSSDETAELLAAAARSDRRIRVIGGPARGVSAARNAGLAVACGEIIAFLDADDIWEAQRLSMLLWKFRDQPEAGIVYSRFAFFSGQPGDTPTQSSVPKNPLGVLDLLCENRVGTMSNLVVKNHVAERVGKFREEMTHGEDREWLVRAAALGVEISGLDSLLLHYRTSPKGLSSDTEKMLAGWRESVATAARLGALPTVDELRAAESIYLRYLSRRALRLGMPAKVAAKYALRGAVKSPLGFFGDRRRGTLTFSAALANLIAPAAVQNLLANR